MKSNRIFKTLARNISVFTVYVAFILRAFSFIIIIPTLTRVISPVTWGAILSAQALAMWLILLIDFSFTLSLARKIAVFRDDINRVRQDVSNVYSAKLLLLLPAALVCWITTKIGILHHFPALVWWAFAWAAIQGFSPLWYYQATEKMYRFSIIDIIGRVLYITLVLYFIRDTDHAYLILAFQALTLFIVNAFTLQRLYTEIGGVVLSFGGALQALKEGMVLSGFSLLTSIYTTASTFLFGLFAIPTNVALYGNADKLVRSGISLLSPLNQLLLPRSARAYAESMEVGTKLAMRFLMIYGVIGIMGFFIGWFVSPLAVSLLFGHQYSQTLLYLRWLLLLFPLTSINTVIVYHILIPNKQEALITKVYGLISIIALFMIVIMVPKFGGNGMVFSMVMPEMLAIIILSSYAQQVTGINKTKLRVLSE